MTANTSALADAYAALKFEEEKLAKRISELREEILTAGANDRQLVGDTCIVALVDKKGSETLDKAGALALLKSLGASEDQVAKLIKVGKASTSLMIKAKLELAA